jgi:hypothetical protein
VIDPTGKNPFDHFFKIFMGSDGQNEKQGKSEAESHHHK